MALLLYDDSIHNCVHERLIGLAHPDGRSVPCTYQSSGSTGGGLNPVSIAAPSLIPANNHELQVYIYGAPASAPIITEPAQITQRLNETSAPGSCSNLPGPACHSRPLPSFILACRPPALRTGPMWPALSFYVLAPKTPFAPPEQVLTFGRALQAAGLDWRVNIYGGAKHAFDEPLGRRCSWDEGDSSDRSIGTI